MEPNMPYLMWMKSKQLLSSSPPISWEEQAFAEDAAGPFVWPPRSYSCTFCNREFRSAQALGGHMNVHRRDRARLKQQSLSDETDSSPSRVSPKNSDQETDQEPVSSNKKKRVSFSLSSSSTSPDDNNDRPKTPVMLLRSWSLDEDNVVETNLSVGMKSYGSKRLKSGAATPSSSFYHKRPCSSSSIDDVDLELRLGDSPAPAAVK